MGIKIPKKDAVEKDAVEKSADQEKCVDCKEPTNDFYPVPGKDKEGVRCSDCQERWIRQSHRDDSRRDGNFNY